MSNLSRVFAFDECMVRVVGEPGSPMFVAADVCRALGIEQPASAVRNHPEDEKGMHQTHTLGGLQEVLVVSEPGLYRLIFRSDKPEAERFRRWVFHEVLPEIRRTGRFSVGVESEPMWAAFGRAKTGRVQMALLAAMGIQDAPAARAQPVRTMTGKPVSDFEEGEFWSAVPSGREYLRAALSTIRGSDYDLWMEPDAVVKALRRTERWAPVTRQTLHQAVSSLDSYFSGRSKCRFGEVGSMKACSTWLFKVSKNSNPTLVALCERNLLEGK